MIYTTYLILSVGEYYEVIPSDSDFGSEIESLVLSDYLNKKFAHFRFPEGIKIRAITAKKKSSDI